MAVGFCLTGIPDSSIFAVMVLPACMESMLGFVLVAAMGTVLISIVSIFSSGVSNISAVEFGFFSVTAIAVGRETSFSSFGSSTRRVFIFAIFAWSFLVVASAIFL